MLFTISVTPLNASMVNANNLTEDAETRAASTRPIFVNIRITGTASSAEIITSIEGSVPKGTIARRINAVTLNTANKVKRISLIGQACL